MQKLQLVSWRSCNTTRSPVRSFSIFLWLELVNLLQIPVTCIDLVIANQPHLVMESGVHSSFSSTCHHEIVFAKLNLKVEHPAPYERIFWDYSRAERASINRTINAIDWEELFVNKTVESQVDELNNLLLNIYSNCIPNKTVLRDDKDGWLME